MIGVRKVDRVFTLYLPILLYGLFTLIPLYSMVVIAFNAGTGVNGLFRPLPVNPTLNHFTTLFSQDNFDPYIRNSLVVAAATVVADVPLSVLTGYALSRFRFPGRLVFMLALLTTQFVPASMMIIPLAIIFKFTHLLNTLIGLVIINTTFELPFAAILMRGFVSSIPRELEEASHVDGCTGLQSIAFVVVPLLRPALAAVAAFVFVGAWNNFLFALFLIDNQELYTVPVALSYFLGEYNVNYGNLAAAGLVAAIPVLIVFTIVQRYLTGGLTVGAVKG